MPLPVPNDTIRIRYRANLVNGSGVPVDEAQFGFWGVRQHFAGNPTDWPQDVQDWADAARDKWNDHMTHKGLFSSAVHMDTVTVDHLAASDGSVIDQGVASFSGGDAWVGEGSASLPWECSLCVSLYGYTPGSFAAHKPRKRGRFYLPPISTGAITGVEGQIDSSNLGILSDDIGAFLNDIQGMQVPAGTTVNGDYFDLRVISRGTQAKPLAPTSTQVILAQIDSKVDSQRRREKQEPALATESTVIAHANP